jgi:uncharacterized protein (DUF2141 family)
MALLIGLGSFRGEVDGSLKVTVKNVKEATGKVMVGLFATEDEFLKKPRIGKSVKASPGEVTVVFENVPPGEYAISVIHDRNENDELDSNFLGMPTEGFGFSKDVMGMFGPPSFEKAKFRLEGDQAQVVTMRYL